MNIQNNQIPTPLPPHNQLQIGKSLKFKERRKYLSKVKLLAFTYCMENGRVLDEYRKALMEIYNLSKTQPLDFKKKSQLNTNKCCYIYQ